MQEAGENEDIIVSDGEVSRSFQPRSDSNEREEKTGFIDREPRRSSDRKTSYMSRLKTDSAYKENVIVSLVLCWTFVTLGWASAQFGPAFLDLQIITRTNVKKASGFLTVRSVGFLAGSILTGILFDRYSKLLLVSIFPLAGAVISAVLPWCFLYELMMAVHVCAGFYQGGIGASGNALLMYTWGREGNSFMQALHFSFAFGGIMSPLATSPFSWTHMRIQLTHLPLMSHPSVRIVTTASTCLTTQTLLLSILVSLIMLLFHSLTTKITPDCI
ncbi:sodium-dependent glucose transporter 1-like [Pecten maximus]|uniref:sodium-dependent glucose transporter 1-like n=1 Tax=Pecten maximus TaxID=6579 RepID=UPI001458FB3A|nr:sodium-dependent glucose transporter 1-like [Pecten maximus]